MNIAAPFQLIEYHIEALSLKRLHPDVEEPPGATGIALGFGIELRPNVESEEGVHALELTIQANEDEDQIPEGAEHRIFHRASVTLVGYFTWLEDAEPDDTDEAEKLLLVNGLTMLYGTARVHLQQLTEPGSDPPLQLPTVSFLPIVEEWLDADESESPVSS
jgi:preprotein translocase subunit SecB